MKHPFPYPPIRPRALAAMEEIERATTLKGLDDAFNIVSAETLRHYGPSVLIAVLTMSPFAVLAGAANMLGWIGPTDTWMVALVPVLGLVMLPASEYLLRCPRRSEDDRRLRDALNVRRVLDRAEKKA